MSGRELDPDGTDSYHPQHPWEQTSSPLYITPDQRWRGNWPPVPAQPSAPHEASAWRDLPDAPPASTAPWWRETFGPGYTYQEGDRA